MASLNVRKIAAAIALSLATLTGCHRSQTPAEQVMLADPNDWPQWGRTGHETHYSPLDELKTGNVGDLKLAWHYDLEPGYSASSPIEAEGKLFITTGHSHIRAFDAATGKLLWEYDGGTRTRATMPLHMSWGNKGIAYDKGRVFLGTTDGFVVALDAKSGKEAWKTRDFGPDEKRNMNGAPRVFAGKVIVGHGGADVSPLRGWVSAYDENTGKLAWRFYTVPGDPSKPATTKAEQLERATWKGDWFGKGGGGTAWNAFSYDPELNLIYLGIGNGYPYGQNLRSPGGGDNLFLASIVAVDANTGEYRWHYQVCPAEQWDCTATTDMTLATIEIDGKPRKVLMQAPKNGFFYVVDRATGQLISAEKIAKVTWAKGIDLKTGRPIENPGIRYQGKPGMFELWPGPTGAHSWPPQAFSPQTGLMYIPVIEQGALIGEGQKGGELGINIGANLLPEAELPGGRHSFLKAWNPITQKEAWRVEQPGSWPGGVLATAGGLVFEGRVDGSFVAYDATDGKELWSFKAQAPIVGPPISYKIGNTQYVTVLTGNGGNGAGITSIGQEPYRTDYLLPRHVLTFAIGGKDALPAFTPPKLVPPADPTFKVDLARAQKGAIGFGVNGCIACHGWNAIGGGAAPDLRYSGAIVDPATLKAIVKGGALKPNGMPVFPQLSDAQLEDIRFYLRARAQAAPAEQAALLARTRKEAADANVPPAAFAGKWNIEIATPVGTQKAVATFAVAGTAISGTVAASQGSVDVKGEVKNGRATMSGHTLLPFPMTIEYSLTIRDGKIVGDNKNGAFGTFPVTGAR